MKKNRECIDHSNQLFGEEHDTIDFVDMVVASVVVAVVVVAVAAVVVVVVDILEH